MHDTLQSHKIDAAVAAMRDMKTAIVEAECQISECLKNRASEKEMLASLLAQSKTTGDSDYLKTATKACRLGIKAWNLSITAFEQDIGFYRTQVDEILERIPELRRDH